MTLICIKNGIVAADTATHRESFRAGNVQKLVRSQDGAIGGASGNVACAMEFQAWFKLTEFDYQRRQWASIPSRWTDADFAAVWLEPDGSIWHMDFRGTVYSIGESTVSHGSEEDLAMGAMLFGASAEQAVRICIEHSAWIAGDVQVERLASVKEEPEMTAEQAQAYARQEDIYEADDQKVAEGTGRDPDSVADWRDRMGLR